MGSCCSLANNEEGNECREANGAWLKSLCKRMETWPFLVLAGACLIASLIISGHGNHDTAILGMKWLDPAMVAVLVCGLPIAREAFAALFADRRIVSALLITSAMVACLAIGQTFAAGEVAFIMALGETLEEKTLGRAKRGLTKLMSLVPPTARRIITCPKCLARGEKFRIVPVEQLEVGDGVRVLPGETIPVDGIITEGATSVDQSVVTGESLPVDKSSGDEVYSGTINQYGAVNIRVTKTGEDSSIQKMVRLVREAAKRKAPMQRIADKWAAVLVVVSLCLAVLTFLGIWALNGDLSVGLTRGVTILVVFCPCALALATPTAVMAAIGQAARHGVIIKSGEALELMGAVNLACLDKTGTLTTGKLSVANVESFAPGITHNEILRLAAAVEESSEHPLAKAIVAERRRIDSVREIVETAVATDFVMSPGKGVRGTVDGRLVVCGTESWLRETGVSMQQLEKESNSKRLSELRNEGKAVILVASGGEVVGLVALSDSPRDGARDVVSKLAETGVESLLLTGDHAATANAVATTLGITKVRSNLLPEEKATAIETMQNEGKIVCMVGDGVNDAVALKTADVGVAMGGVGSDIAVDAADIALVGDDLSRLTYLKLLSVACVKLIRLNIIISLCINFVAICCSILGVLTPVTGALVHNAGSVLVVLNAALLYDRNISNVK